MGMNIVKIISDEIDDLKRRIIKFLRLGKKDVQTSYESSPYGTDSSPIKGMKAIYGQTSSNGETVIIGYINENQISKPGEHRIYATDKDGDEQLHIYLKDDGSGEIGGTGDFLVRYSKLETAFNQLKSDFNNHITTYNSLVNIFNAHVHPYVGLPVTVPGITTPTATPTVPSTPSFADISPAKIDKLETI